MSYRDEYLRWCEKAEDQEIAAELKAMTDEAVEDAFYRNLSFGTAGLRGVLGAGTNRMNIYTVAKATQGLANYIIANYEEGKRSVAISYDSRIKSDVFAREAAGVFAANGIKSYIYPELMPVPCLSFAVRQYKTSAGIMVTASHNPGKYNGYKVYGPDGCQCTTESAEAVLKEIEKLDLFEDVAKMSFDDGIKAGLIEYIGEQTFTDFTEAVKERSVLYGDEINKDVAIVYSPLNGAGLRPVTRVLNESGYTNITIVKEQELPDGNFPTCPYPNPEIREAMELGIKYAKKCDADILIATDPDCDRMGIAVKDDKGEFVLLSGNETGMLLLDYVCSQRTKHGKMPENPVFVKTIVSTDMAKQIADHYGVKTIDVLTGFKFIGEQILRLEEKGKEDSFIFGFEESYGYLSGSHARDKDAVNASFLVCEMFCYYKTQGISVYEKLDELYRTYGYCINKVHSFQFEGSAGFARMQEIMSTFRQPIDGFGGRKIVEVKDFSKGIDGLPTSDVIKFIMEDKASVIVRPSGTEPKMKAYISVSEATREESLAMQEKILADVSEYFK